MRTLRPLLAVALVAATSYAVPTIVGTQCPELPSLRWIQGGPLRLQQLRGQVVLIRFFMEPDCVYCRGTAPSLNELHRTFGPRGLTVVGIYTPRPRLEGVSADEAQRTIDSYGFRFPVALDDKWVAVRRLWLDREPETPFSSATLVIDRHGTIRYVHEGGIWARDSSDPGVRRDYDTIRSTLEDLLENR